MKWLRMLATAMGALNENVFQRYEYVLAEKQILRNQIPEAGKLTDVDRRTLAELGKKQGRNVLAEIGSIVRPETILGWSSKLVAKKWDTSKRKKGRGLMTYYVLFFIEIGSRRVHLAGITPNPDEGWMMQIARNVTMGDLGFLKGSRYLLHDRDSKFGPSFRATIGSGGVTTVRLPARSPNLNAFAERWVRSVKEERLGRMVPLGEGFLRRAVEQFLAHYHGERNHQGRDNVLIVPRAEDRIGQREGRLRCRRRLGGLLNFYYRAA